MITISDVNGSRNFLLRTVIKKIVFYIILAVILLMVSGMLYINYLNENVEKLSKTKTELREKNEKLLKSIELSKREFDAIEGKITDLEEQLGLNTDETKELVDRIVNVTLTGAEERAMFSQIPNGKILDNITVTAKFGWRDHPILNRKEFHPGLDLRAKLGTPVYAPADGVVQFDGKGATGYGHLLEIRHNFGFATRYAHLNKQKVVKAGQFVKKGDIVAYTGNSGLSTGPHLHYEIRFIQRPLNPMNFINWNNTNYKEIFKKEKGIPWQSLVEALTKTGKQL